VVLAAPAVSVAQSLQTPVAPVVTVTVAHVETPDVPPGPTLVHGSVTVATGVAPVVIVTVCAVLVHGAVIVEAGAVIVVKPPPGCVNVVVTMEGAPHGAVMVETDVTTLPGMVSVLVT